MRTGSEAVHKTKVNVRARGLLFDMDGVLISSLGSVERSWQIWAQRYGLDVAETIKTAHGNRAIDTLRKLRPDVDHLAELKIIEDLEVADNEGLEILEGVLPILQSVPQKYWTIVTSATERLARSRLAHAGIPVPHHIVTADMVTNGKPHPEPYLKGAAMLHLPPSDCIVLEDSSSGARAGHEAGCKVLATTFSHSIESLAAADWIVESLAKVKVTVLPDEAGLELEFERIR
jgi:mannitol-1-/sugar-/sorbitol-6-phosphatase